LVLEKLPFLALSAIACGFTLRAQSADGAIITTSALPMARRLANAALAYCQYLGKTLWPAHLAVFYPYGQPHPAWLVWLAGAGLAVITAGALWLKKFRCVAVGWLWYAGMLVPVIGLVQVGSQGLADRYTYLPSIGLFILGAFGISPLAARFRRGKAAAAVVAGLALAGCLAASRQQVSCWRNSETLFRHAVAVTRSNYTAYTILGSALQSQGRAPEAIECYRKALLASPVYADAHWSLADAYAALKQPREAVAEYQTALKLNPKLAQAHYGLANALLAEGDAAGAAEHYRAALAIKPRHAGAHYQLAAVLMARGEIEAASGHYREAIRLKPDWVEALNNLAWSLATQPEARFRDGKEAVQLAARAVALTHTNNPGMLDTLAGAFAEAGRFDDAVKTAQTAASLAHTSGAGSLERQIQAHLQCYERGQPFREPESAPIPKPGESQ
jgi:tetratricopeptide (TPR) repeat protein